MQVEAVIDLRDSFHSIASYTKATDDGAIQQLIPIRQSY